MTYRTVGKALGRVGGLTVELDNGACVVRREPRRRVLFYGTVGVRLCELSISAEKLYHALHTRQHTPLLAPQTP